MGAKTPKAYLELTDARVGGGLNLAPHTVAGIQSVRACSLEQNWIEVARVLRAAVRTFAAAASRVRLVPDSC